ncbi:putative DNA polymerase [Frankliniella fusca]|uniref:DNA-directed DNA polymerase n=1 Tax=Frankliniella fusca TaxID=407009 RepID=A0AAE1HNW6_9NEOP|nr:putative DNA polymerase [Frankliniella fusca]
MENVSEILDNWRHHMYEPEQLKAEVFQRLMNILCEWGEVPQDLYLLDVLESGYRAYLNQLIYHQKSDSSVHLLYALVRNRRFKTTFRAETFKVSNLQDKLLKNQLGLESLFDDLLQRQVEIVNADPDDKCCLELRGSDENRPLWFNLRPVHQLSGNVIVDKLVNTLNSNENFVLDTFQLTFIHVPKNEGGARLRLPFESLDRWIERHCQTKTLFDPQNENDNMCLARCIAYLDLFQNANKHLASRLRRPQNKQLRKASLSLCEIAGVSPTDKCGYDEICKFAAVRPNHRIVVFLDKKCKEIYFNGDKRDANNKKKEKTMYIFLHNDHYYAVTSITAATGFNTFCDNCLKSYGTDKIHKCLLTCDRCEGDEYHEKRDNPLIKCFDCGRWFAGPVCLENHKTVNGQNKSVCQIKKFCGICEQAYVLNRKVKQHRCGFKICKYCTEYVPANHKCYMMPWEPKPLPKNTRMIRLYFDIETDQSQQYECKAEWFEHKPNLLICQHVCQDCEHDANIKNNCHSCGVRQHVFEGFEDNANVVSDFLDFLQALCSEQKTEVTIFAHNAKNFDNFFVFQELKRRQIPPTVVLNGAKVLSLKTEGLHFKDSIMFLPQRLSSLPKAFGLTELKKGYFPHLANRKEFYNYEGKILDKELYCTNNFCEKELSEFNSWYDEHVNNNFVFKFKEEIISYCISDVQILREAMENFRRLFMETAQFDPLRECLTLSSACMCNFRKNHLGNSRIGIVPRGGYRGRDKASFEALKWLDYESHLIGKKILTAENGREQIVLKYKVDGYIELDLPDGSVEKRVYQYHGCYFHLCKRCIPDETSRSKIRGRSQEDPYEKTRFITKKLRDHGYVVIEKWGCEFQHDLKNKEQVIQFFKNHAFKRIEPLKLRDAIYGGRTSALYSAYEADLSKGESIKLYDVISEYPSVQYHKWYPEGHPKIYLDGDRDMPAVENLNGVILATVLPPQDLFLPVLPYRCCNKLMFPLCRTCAETMNQSDCHHADHERELLGTWCAPEFHLAIEKKYTVRKIHEVYQYDSGNQYDPVTGKDGMFTSYVRENMAMKIEASGWPSHVVTENDKDEYIRYHLEKDGIRLNKDKFERNPGKRFLAKLILNSFWGKLGEKTLRSKTEFVRNYAELTRLTEDSTIEISSLMPLDDDLIQVVYTPHADMEDSLRTTSLVHAAFTTCHGRLMLYEYLSIVDERALYHDTDSICFISKPGYPEPVVGQSLGSLSDEITERFGERSMIVSFVSGGCKNYAFKVAVNSDMSKLKTCIKVRGISIDGSCSNLVTFDRLCSMVKGHHERTIVSIPKQITRLKWKIITKPSQKVWRTCLNKRRRVQNKTVPYGFTAELLDDIDYELMDFLETLQDE